MKKFFVMMLAMTMMGTTAFGAETLQKYAVAKPMVQNVTFDGNQTVMECYNIDGYNYFRLRDVAEQVTEHMEDPYHYFNVRYNADGAFVVLERQKEYAQTGTSKKYEAGDANKVATLSEDRVMFGNLNGYYNFKGYKVDGYNFYKLRDLARDLEINVEWDEETGTIILTSNTEERAKEILRGAEE